MVDNNLLTHPQFKLRFEIINEINKGSFGTVFLCRCT